MHDIIDIDCNAAWHTVTVGAGRWGVDPAPDHSVTAMAHDDDLLPDVFVVDYIPANIPA